MLALGFVTVLQLPGHQSFLFLTGVGRNRTLAPLAVIGAVANLAGSVAATFWLGPIGPATGSLPVVVVLEFFVLPVVVAVTYACQHGATSAGLSPPLSRSSLWPRPLHWSLYIFFPMRTASVP